MAHRRWEHVRVLNLSDLRNPVSRQFLRLVQARRVTELSQKAPRQLPPPRARRGQRRVEFPRAQVQEPARRRLRERRRHPPPGLDLHPRRRREGVLHEQQSVRRQNHV